jgi:hypothetical protein
VTPGQTSLFDRPVTPAPPEPGEPCPTDEIPYGYCRCGCGQKTSIATRNEARRGHVKGEPMPFLQHHNPPLPPWAPHEREYRVESRGYETPCWIWQRAISSTGYGTITRRRGVRGLAHRLYYEWFVGPIPDGLVIDHLCRNPACVNPEHLEPVAQTENVRRGAGTKLTYEQVEAIRASTETNAALGLKYGIHPAHISRVRRGKKWGDRRAA